VSNTFPSVPTDFANLASIEYLFNPGAISVSVPAGTSVQAGGTISDLGAVPNSFVVTFSTPGEVGSFDQTSFEEMVSGVVTAICQVLASANDVSLSSYESEMADAVVRTWTWVDSAGNTANYTDRMTYPAS
jgi:hypothetical protein